MQLEVGTVLEGKVTGITNFGAFVELPGGKTGMVHISEVAPTFVKEIRDFVSENQVVKVKILNITPEGKISLSMKRVAEPAKSGGGNRPSRPGRYEWTTK
jgi:S1 RNA binding domain protein